MSCHPQFNPKNIDWNLLRKLIVDDGLSIRDAAIQFDVAPATINWHARKDKWNVGSVRKAHNLTKAAKDGKVPRAPSGHLLATRGTVAVLAQFNAANVSTRQNIALSLQKATRQLSSMTAEQLLERTRELKCLCEAANLVFGWTDPKRSYNGSQSDALKPDMFVLTPDQLSKLAATEIDATPIAPLD